MSRLTDLPDEYRPIAARLSLDDDDLAFDAEELDAYTAIRWLRSLPAEFLTQMRARPAGPGRLRKKNNSSPGHVSSRSK